MPEAFLIRFPPPAKEISTPSPHLDSFPTSPSIVPSSSSMPVFPSVRVSSMRLGSGRVVCSVLCSKCHNPFTVSCLPPSSHDHSYKSVCSVCGRGVFPSEGPSLVHDADKPWKDIVATSLLNLEIHRRIKAIRSKIRLEERDSGSEAGGEGNESDSDSYSEGEEDETNDASEQKNWGWFRMGDIVRFVLKNSSTLLAGKTTDEDDVTTLISGVLNGSSDIFESQRRGPLKTVMWRVLNACEDCEAMIADVLGETDKSKEKKYKYKTKKEKEESEEPETKKKKKYKTSSKGKSETDCDDKMDDDRDKIDVTVETVSGEGKKKGRKRIKSGDDAVVAADEVIAPPKPKRKRRTKLEMQRDRELNAQKEAAKTKRKSQELDKKEKQIEPAPIPQGVKEVKKEEKTRRKSSGEGKPNITSPIVSIKEDTNMIDVLDPPKPAQIEPTDVVMVKMSKPESKKKRSLIGPTSTKIKPNTPLPIVSVPMPTIQTIIDESLSRAKSKKDTPKEKEEEETPKQPKKSTTKKSSSSKTKESSSKRKSTTKKSKSSSSSRSKTKKSSRKSTTKKPPVNSDDSNPAETSKTTSKHSSSRNARKEESPIVLELQIYSASSFSSHGSLAASSALPVETRDVVTPGWRVINDTNMDYSDDDDDKDCPCVMHDEYSDGDDTDDEAIKARHAYAQVLLDEEWELLMKSSRRDRALITDDPLKHRPHKTVSPEAHQEPVLHVDSPLTIMGQTQDQSRL